MRKHIPSTRALLAFEAVARRRSFALAASELHLTASAVSHQVARLEAHLGVRLFERRAGRYTATPAGEALAEAARLTDPTRARSLAAWFDRANLVRDLLRTTVRTDLAIVEVPAEDPVLVHVQTALCVHCIVTNAFPPPAAQSLSATGDPLDSPPAGVNATDDLP